MMAYMSETAMTTYRGGQVPDWTLGWKLKRALDFAGLSAQEMAAELGVHVGTVSRWMNDRETPRRAYLMAWALRCGVAFSWLTEDESPQVSPDIAVHPSRPAGIPSQPATPGHAPVDNEITRLRKRIPLNPALALVLRLAA
jgi:transcriptional regulator with XRE-family HTH domain